MRGTVTLIASALLVMVASGWDQPVPFERDGKWGYRYAGGRIVIPPRFELANAFSAEGIAAVVDDKGWAYIDGRGRLLLRPFVFDNGPDYFSENLARFTEGGKFGFFDRRGRTVIPPRFDFAAPFSESRAAVCQGCQEVFHGEHSVREGGKWGYIDRAGTVVIAFRFDEAEDFAKGKARVRLAGTWQYINAEGRAMSESSIGVATMESDGTIVLQLRAVDGKSLGDGLFKYPTGHPRYEEILRHLGGLRRGESKPVPPWPSR